MSLLNVQNSHSVHEYYEINNNWKIKVDWNRKRYILPNTLRNSTQQCLSIESKSEMVPYHSNNTQFAIIAHLILKSFWLACNMLIGLMCLQFDFIRVYFMECYRYRIGWHGIAVRWNGILTNLPFIELIAMHMALLHSKRMNCLCVIVGVVVVIILKILAHAATKL